MIYGAYSHPQTFWEKGATFAEYGINALFVHSGRIDAALIDRAAAEGAPVYAEFATCRGDYLLDKYPDITPIGRDGLPIPRTERFLGACPSHPQLLPDKAAALRRLVQEQPVAGVWLDYLHFHCDFELPDPPLDQSCFCDHCLDRFTRATRIKPAGRTTAEKAEWLLSRVPDAWTQWKCDVIAAGAADCKRIIERERPGVPLGLYCAPWTDTDHGGALRTILGNDLEQLHGIVDVFSPMLYQVKCGRPPGWIEQYTRWLVQRVEHLNRRSGRQVQVWPIVEAEGATGLELEAVLRGALQAGAGGVMFYALPHVAADPAKMAAVKRVYRGET